MSICLSVCLSPPAGPRTRPHQISRIRFDNCFQGSHCHLVAKDSCLPVTMASEFLNIAIARTCGGANKRWRGHVVVQTFLTLPYCFFLFFLKAYTLLLFFLIFTIFKYIYVCVQNKHT